MMRLKRRQSLLRQLMPAENDATLNASYQQLDILKNAFSAESALINDYLDQCPQKFKRVIQK